MSAAAAAVNPVEVDDAALDAEVERLILEAPVDSAAPGEAPPSEEAASSRSSGWGDITPGITAAVDILVIPQWGVTEHEKQVWTEALTGLLDAAFPGGLEDERYAPYIRFSLVSFGVVMAHRDPVKGFPPLWPKRVEPDPAPQPTSSSNAHRPAH